MNQRDSQHYAIILAGGSGTRLWPLSRSLRPKHLLSLLGESSLLQQTVQRVLPLVFPENVMTVTHEKHLFEAKKQLSDIDPLLAQNILAEPQANNTLPAIAWAVARIAAQSPEALISVFPSDHVITDLPCFQSDWKKALQVAGDQYLVTFGIRPASAETGYGYIETGNSLGPSAYAVESFKEKPDLQTAKQYLQKGRYYWNSGIFVFRASTFQKELQHYEPDLFKSIQRMVQHSSAENIRKEYSSMKSVSIDYGLMEKSNRVAVVPASFGWSDLGSWEAVYQQEPKDQDQNVIQGNVLPLSTKSSLLISKKGLLATIGLQEMVVIQTEDAVLVSPRQRVQEVKQIVETLKKSHPETINNTQTTIRPWGRYTILEEGLGYKIKRIVVNPEQKLSLQRHAQRAEHWVVIEGLARVTKGSNTFDLQPNQSAYIEKGENHRLENVGQSPLVIIEVQTGSYLGEDDIVRIDDLYGRIT